MKLTIIEFPGPMWRIKLRGERRYFKYHYTDKKYAYHTVFNLRKETTIPEHMFVPISETMMDPTA